MWMFIKQCDPAPFNTLIVVLTSFTIICYCVCHFKAILWYFKDHLMKLPLHLDFLSHWWSVSTEVNFFRELEMSQWNCTADIANWCFSLSWAYGLVGNSSWPHAVHGWKCNLWWKICFSCVWHRGVVQGGPLVRRRHWALDAAYNKQETGEA